MDCLHVGTYTNADGVHHHKLVSFASNYILPATTILMRVQLYVRLYIIAIRMTMCARCSPNCKMMNKQTNKQTDDGQNNRYIPATP